MSVNYNPRTVTDGLVLCLDAGNRKSYPGSGTTWTDLSGRGNTGTLTNGPTYSSSNGGNIVFDGTDDYISIPHTTNFNLAANNFTIEGWLYSYVESQTSVFVNKRTTVNNVRWIAIALQTNQIKFWASSNNSTWDISNAVPFGNISINTPYYFSVVRNGTSFTGYLNTIPTSIATSSATIADNTSNLILGADIDMHRLNGSISNFRIYNRALSAAEIQQNFNALRSRFSI